MNGSQRSGIANALGNKLSLINGPPGTGKSTTISTLAYNLKIGGKVLVVAPSNSATDSLVLSLASAGMKVCRVMSISQQHKVDETIPVYDHCLHAKCKLIEFSEDFTHIEKVREAKRDSW